MRRGNCNFFSFAFGKVRVADVKGAIQKQEPESEANSALKQLHYELSLAHSFQSVCPQ